MPVLWETLLAAQLAFQSQLGAGSEQDIQHASGEHLSKNNQMLTEWDSSACRALGVAGAGRNSSCFFMKEAMLEAAVILEQC